MRCKLRGQSVWTVHLGKRAELCRILKRNSRLFRSSINPDLCQPESFCVPQGTRHPNKTHTALQNQQPQSIVCRAMAKQKGYQTIQSVSLILCQYQSHPCSKTDTSLRPYQLEEVGSSSQPRWGQKLPTSERETCSFGVTLSLRDGCAVLSHGNEPR